MTLAQGRVRRGARSSSALGLLRGQAFVEMLHLRHRPWRSPSFPRRCRPSITISLTLAALSEWSGATRSSVGFRRPRRSEAYVRDLLRQDRHADHGMR